MSDQGSTYDESFDSSSHELDSVYSDEAIPVVDIAEIIGDCGACDFNTAAVAVKIAKLEKDLSKLETARQKKLTATETTATSDEFPAPRTSKAAKNAKKNARRKVAKKLKKARGGALEPDAIEPIVTEPTAIEPSVLDTEMIREMSEKVACTEAQITDIEAQIAAYKHRERIIVLKCRARRYYWYIHNVSLERQHLEGDELDIDNASPVDYLSYGRSLSLLRSQAVECEREIAALEQVKADQERGLPATTPEQDTDSAEEPEVTGAMLKEEAGGTKESEVTETMLEQEAGDAKESGMVVSTIEQGKSHFEWFMKTVMNDSKLALGLLLVLVPVLGFVGFSVAVFYYVCKGILYAVC